MKDGAAGLQLGSDFQGVSQVAVMGQCRMALHVVHHNGLHVRKLVAAGGTISSVANGNGSRAQLIKHFWRENVIDQA